MKPNNDLNDPLLVKCLQHFENLAVLRIKQNKNIKNNIDRRIDVMNYIKYTANNYKLDIFYAEAVQIHICGQLENLLQKSTISQRFWSKFSNYLK